MKAGRQYKESQKAEPIQSKRESSHLSFEDNRSQTASQTQLVNSIQRENNSSNISVYKQNKELSTLILERKINKQDLYQNLPIQRYITFNPDIKGDFIIINYAEGDKGVGLVGYDERNLDLLVDALKKEYLSHYSQEQITKVFINYAGTGGELCFKDYKQAADWAVKNMGEPSFVDEEIFGEDGVEIVDGEIENPHLLSSDEGDREIPDVGKMVKAKNSQISQVHTLKQKGLKKWKRYLASKNPDLYTTKQGKSFYVHLDHISVEDAQSFFQDDPKCIVRNGDSYYGYVC